MKKGIHPKYDKAAGTLSRRAAQQMRYMRKYAQCATRFIPASRNTLIQPVE